MIHCKDCKHWGAESILGDGSRACRLISTDFGYDYDQREQLLPLARLVGTEATLLSTEPDFGCVHGEEKRS